MRPGSSHHCMAEGWDTKGQTETRTDPTWHKGKLFHQPSVGAGCSRGCVVSLLLSIQDLGAQSRWIQMPYLDLRLLKNMDFCCWEVLRNMPLLAGPKQSLGSMRSRVKARNSCRDALLNVVYDLEILVVWEELLWKHLKNIWSLLDTSLISVGKSIFTLQYDLYNLRFMQRLNRKICPFISVALAKEKMIENISLNRNWECNSLSISQDMLVFLSDFDTEIISVIRC